ncbi:MAG: hypothetical protein IJH37_10905 [Clostridia bacterium]|nr:hypothetical protein [Clostridia bacterium]
MMYPFMTLPDDTTITHSEMQPDGSVRVYVETPDEKDGFHNAWCILPQYRWENVHGYSDPEIAEYQDLIGSVAHLIIEFSKEGGFANAANF